MRVLPFQIQILYTYLNRKAIVTTPIITTPIITTCYYYHLNFSVLLLAIDLEESRKGNGISWIPVWSLSLTQFQIVSFIKHFRVSALLFWVTLELGFRHGSCRIPVSIILVGSSCPCMS
jgi:hypothetical protein